MGLCKCSYLLWKQFSYTCLHLYCSADSNRVVLPQTTDFKLRTKIKRSPIHRSNHFKPSIIVAIEQQSHGTRISSSTISASSANAIIALAATPDEIRHVIPAFLAFEVFGPIIKDLLVLVTSTPMVEPDVPSYLSNWHCWLLCGNVSSSLKQAILFPLWAVTLLPFDAAHVAPFSLAFTLFLCQQAPRCGCTIRTVMWLQPVLSSTTRLHLSHCFNPESSQLEKLLRRGVFWAVADMLDAFASDASHGEASWTASLVIENILNIQISRASRVAAISAIFRFKLIFLLVIVADELSVKEMAHTIHGQRELAASWRPRLLLDERVLDKFLQTITAVRVFAGHNAKTRNLSGLCNFPTANTGARLLLGSKFRGRTCISGLVNIWSTLLSTRLGLGTRSSLYQILHIDVFGVDKFGRRGCGILLLISGSLAGRPLNTPIMSCLGSNFIILSGVAGVALR